MFPIKNFWSKWPNPKFPVDLVRFTADILREKIHYLRSDIPGLLLLDNEI